MKSKKAIALAYPEGACAPIITASASGELAEKILEIAHENDVTIVENESLLSVLSTQKIGTLVPEETWSVLAKIFAFVIEQNDKKV